jgi:hypothetical protein
LASLAPAALAHVVADFECAATEWRQAGMMEANEGGTPILTPGTEFTADLIARTSPCTPVHAACGAPTQTVRFSMRPLPSFVHGALQSASVAIAQDDPGNMEARVKFAYRIDARTSPGQLFFLGADAQCPSGRTLLISGNFTTGVLAAITADAGAGHRSGDGADWTLHVGNAGNARLAITLQLHGADADEGNRFPVLFVLARPSSAAENETASIPVHLARAPRVPVVLSLRPYPYGESQHHGAVVNATLRPPTDRATPGPGAVAGLLGLAVGASVMLRRRGD